MQISKEQIDEFWHARSRFLKNTLTTEKPHPKTHNLSQLCQSDLTQAIKIFQEVELQAIDAIGEGAAKICTLKQNIEQCLKNNGNIYLVGCGASARLAVLLRRLWEMNNPSQAGKVISVCAAGDISIIHSVEQFEDSKEYGVRQLKQQGFTNNDLLLGLTASGESPFILACIEYAMQNSTHKPWLVFNNNITDIIERNPDHIAKQDNVNLLQINVGEMALAGSTRLQATTAMQIAVGLGLLSKSSSTSEIVTEINFIHNILSQVDLTKLQPLIELGSGILKKHEYVLYQTNDNLLGLSLLADITERSPTFNIAPFENYLETPSDYSPFYLNLINAHSACNAWHNLLNQNPICLNWKEFSETSDNYMDGFNISQSGNRVNGNYLPQQQFNESWIVNNGVLTIKLIKETVNFSLPEQNNLFCSVLYKLLLNTYSTLMFGRCGYYDGNLMVSVTPSNFKLIDRAIRYSQFILQTKYQTNIPYEDVATVLLTEINKLEPNQSIVHNVVDQLINEKSFYCQLL